MATEHLIPTECDGTTEKSKVSQNVRETVEYIEAMSDPERKILMDTMAELAAIGQKHIIDKNW